MTFQVNPETVLNYGDLIGRNGVNLSLMNVHLAQYGNLGSTDGLLMQTVVGAHDQTVARISDGLYRGFHTMGDGAAELRTAATYYRDTDQYSAARLDSTYPGAPRPMVEPRAAGPVARGLIPDRENPLVHLRQPAQPAEFTDPLKCFNVVDDLMSPSWWMSEVLDVTIGVNPLDIATHYFIGDWEGFARCALVWDDLGRAAGAIGENVKNGLGWLAPDWTGNAGDAAVHYFDNMRMSLFSHRDVLHRLHEKYLDVARGLWNSARAAADILKAFLDKLIILAATALAGSLTSWTGVGAAVAGGLATYECARLVELYGDLTKLLSGAQAAIEAFVGLLQSQDARVLDEIHPTPLPTITYSHPNPEVRQEPTGPGRKGETL